MSKSSKKMTAPHKNRSGFGRCPNIILSPVDSITECCFSYKAFKYTNQYVIHAHPLAKQLAK